MYRSAVLCNGLLWTSEPGLMLPLLSTQPELRHGSCLEHLGACEDALLLIQFDNTRGRGDESGFAGSTSCVMSPSAPMAAGA